MLRTRYLDSDAKDSVLVLHLVAHLDWVLDLEGVDSTTTLRLADLILNTLITQ